MNEFKLYRIVSAIIFNNNKILLVQTKDEYADNTWGIPGGSVELHETLEEALTREVYEETGLKITSKELAYIHESFIPEYKAHSLVTVFKVSTDNFNVKIIDPDNEIVDFKWVEPTNLKKYITNPQIVSPLESWFKNPKTTRYSFDNKLNWNV